MSRADTVAHPLYVHPRQREAATRLLRRALGGALRGARVRRRDARALRVELELVDHPPVTLSWREHGGEDAPALARGARYAASWEAAAEGATSALAERACRALAAPRTPGLVAIPDQAEASPSREVRLEPREMLRWLGEVLPEGARPVSVELGPEHGVIARFEAAPEISVWIHDARDGALFHGRQLALSYLAPDDGPPDERAAPLVFSLGMMLEEAEREVRFIPSQGARMRERPALSVIDEFQASLDGPCGQACAFCCLRPEERRAPAPEDPLSYVAAVRDAAERGARVLRINGVEPLVVPWVPELLAAAAEAGFEAVQIKSSCRPLADRAAAERILRELPLRYRVDVPLYGAGAAIHDRVVASPGAFDEVMAALENVTSLLRRTDELVISTVLVPANRGELPALAELARAQGTRLVVQLPHPTGARAPEVYPRVAMPFSEALAAIFGPEPLDLRFAWGEAPPCTELARERRIERATLTLERFRHRAPALSGALYDVDAIDFAAGDGNRVAISETTPCPHRDGCHLAAACPAEVYSLFAETIGLDELSPVAPEDLEAPWRDPALVEAIAALRDDGAITGSR